MASRVPNCACSAPAVGWPRLLPRHSSLCLAWALTRPPTITAPQLRIIASVIDLHRNSPAVLFVIQRQCNNASFPAWQEWLQRNSRGPPASGVTMPGDNVTTTDPFPPRPNITVTAEVVVTFDTVMVLQPEDSFPRFPGTQGAAAAVHFTMAETQIPCPDYGTPQFREASRR